MAAAAEKIIAEQSVIVDIDSVKAYRKNPRVGNVEAIAESLRENGQFRPIVVNKNTGEILGGNHTWKAAKALKWKTIQAVYVDVDDTSAAKIVLADNRTNDLATYDTEILTDILKGLPTPVGTGYDDSAVAALLEGIRDQDQDLIQDVIRPPMPQPVADDGSGEYADGGAPPVIGNPDGSFGEEIEDDDPTDNEDLRDELGELQGLLQLKEDVQFKSSNYYGIPDLNPKALLQTLPDPIDTWGGADATPDDGVTTWLWNYGVASKKDLPMDRAILCFYTWDTYFESFWDQPAFMTAKVINAGIKYAVVPDFSFYNDQVTATHIFNVYRAQWLGRYFQEAGLQVIPRLQFSIGKDSDHSGNGTKSMDFAISGIPKNPPILAQSIQNLVDAYDFDKTVENTKKGLDALNPGTWLVYGGNPAKRVIDAVGYSGNVVHLMNYAAKRRGVVYDKKEGLAGQKKDKARAKRDRTTEKEESKPATKAKSIQGEQESPADADL